MCRNVESCAFLHGIFAEIALKYCSANYSNVANCIGFIPDNVQILQIIPSLYPNGCNTFAEVSVLLPRHKKKPQLLGWGFFLLVWFTAIKTFVTANPTLRSKFNRNRLICIHNDAINYTLPQNVLLDPVKPLVSLFPRSIEYLWHISLHGGQSRNLSL